MESIQKNTMCLLRISILVYIRLIPSSACGRRTGHRWFFAIVFCHPPSFFHLPSFFHPPSFFPVPPLSCLCPQRPTTLSSVILFHISVHSIHPPCPRSSSFISLSTASIHLALGLPLLYLCPQHPSTLSSVFLFHISVHSIHPPCPRSSFFSGWFPIYLYLRAGIFKRSSSNMP